jgi:hypothetical protein
VIGGGEEAYRNPFQISADDFDQQFDKYLKDRSSRSATASARPTTAATSRPIRNERLSERLLDRALPTGELFAVATGNGSDREMDIVLVSAKDGKVCTNLTSGFDQELGFEYLVTARRPLGHGAVDVVVARWRTARLFRPRRESRER